MRLVLVLANKHHLRSDICWKSTAARSSSFVSTAGLCEGEVRSAATRNLVAWTGGKAFGTSHMMTVRLGMHVSKAQVQVHSTAGANMVLCVVLSAACCLLLPVGCGLLAVGGLFLEKIKI